MGTSEISSEIQRPKMYYILWRKNLNFGFVAKFVLLNFKTFSLLVDGLDNKNCTKFYHF